MTTATVSELRRSPRHGDIRSERPLSADALALSERAAFIRRLRDERRLGIRFVGPDLHRAV